MASWESLRSAQHDAWALVDQAVTEDEKSEGSDKRRALPFYKSGLAALTAAINIDTGNIKDEQTKERADRLKQKIKKNIEYVSERIRVIEALPPATRQSTIRNNRPASTTTSRSNAKQPTQNKGDQTSGKLTLKNVDKNLAEAILSEIVEPAGKGPCLDDVIGLEECKEALNEAVILPALRPDLFTGIRVPPKGVLLFGPPGNGKTLLAKAVANQAKATFFSISASSLISKWMGESEKLVRALFTAARELQPSVIFLDECDSILTERKSGDNDSMRRVKTQFLIECDGLSSGENDRVVLLAATNRPWDLDTAALRRLPRRIYLPLPDAKCRASILAHWLENNKQQAKLSPREIDDLAARTDGYSAADMTQLLRDAALAPIRELSIDVQRTIDRKDIRPINFNDVCASQKKIRPSAHDPAILREYEQWNSEFGSTGL